jgi:hypothetical protein
VAVGMNDLGLNLARVSHQAVENIDGLAHAARDEMGKLPIAPSRRDSSRLPTSHRIYFANQHLFYFMDGHPCHPAAHALARFCV